MATLIVDDGRAAGDVVAVIVEVLVGDIVAPVVPCRCDAWIERESGPSFFGGLVEQAYIVVRHDARHERAARETRGEDVLHVVVPWVHCDIGVSEVLPSITIDIGDEVGGDAIAALELSLEARTVVLEYDLFYSVYCRVRYEIEVNGPVAHVGVRNELHLAAELGTETIDAAVYLHGLEKALGIVHEPLVVTFHALPSFQCRMISFDKLAGRSLIC